MLTQKVDQNDDLLGVYHEWIKRLAERVDRLSVICLYRGQYSLPSNVRVYSLGKESGLSKWKYLKNFYKYIWQLRQEYDLVFVHMNTEYILLGWWLWKRLRKKIVLFFAHYNPDWKLRFSEKVVDRIVTSVPEACNIPSRKITVVGQGIDTERFRYMGVKKKERSILFLGRISPVKNIDTLLDAFERVAQTDNSISLGIVGSAPLADQEYLKGILVRIKASQVSSRIHYYGGVPNHQTPEIYNYYELFINLTPTGSFDKSILESMACETPVLVSNKAFVRIFPSQLRSRLMFGEGDSEELSNKIQEFFQLPQAEVSKAKSFLREIVVHNYSLDHLPIALCKVFEQILYA